MREFSKYSNASLANISGLPIGMIRALRKNVFKDSVARGMKFRIKQSLKEFENGKRKYN